MYRVVLHSKIGNLIAYLAQEVPDLALTKVLKLLYLIDETSVREMGSPITWLDHKVWKLGPVAVEIFREIRHGEKTLVGDKTFSLEDYIQWDVHPNPHYSGQVEVSILSKPEVKPNLMEFSEFEEELIKGIVEEHRYTTAVDLVQLLHKKNTLWHQKVEELELERVFEFRNTSTVSIDFTELIKDDPDKELAAQAAYASLEFELALYELEL
ncbi:MAG: hypothetical protein JWQ98_348 [Chlorobi bacterium]|nr:hypothetical protein [Chlorobiota bacterium]